MRYLHNHGRRRSRSRTACRHHDCRWCAHGGACINFGKSRRRRRTSVQALRRWTLLRWCSWRPQSTELFTAPVATLSRSHLAVHSQAVFTIRDRGPVHLRSSVSRRVRHAAVCAVCVGRHRRGNRCHVGGVDHSPPTHQGRPVATVSADRDITRRTAQHCIAEEPAVLRSSVGSGVSICATAALSGCSP